MKIYMNYISRWIFSNYLGGLTCISNPGQYDLSPSSPVRHEAAGQCFSFTQRMMHRWSWLCHRPCGQALLVAWWWTIPTLPRWGLLILQSIGEFLKIYYVWKQSRPYYCMDFINVIQSNLPSSSTTMIYSLKLDKTLNFFFLLFLID